MSSILPHKVTVRIPFPNHELAVIAKSALEPDTEIKAAQVQKAFTIDGVNLIVCFEADSARMARVSLQAFFDNIEVIVRAMDELKDL